MQDDLKFNMVFTDIVPLLHKKHTANFKGKDLYWRCFLYLASNMNQSNRIRITHKQLENKLGDSIVQVKRVMSYLVSSNLISKIKGARSYYLINPEFVMRNSICEQDNLKQIYLHNRLIQIESEIKKNNTVHKKLDDMEVTLQKILNVVSGDDSHDIQKKRILKLIEGGKS